MGLFKTKRLCKQGGPLDGAKPLIPNDQRVFLVARIFLSRDPSGRLVITQDLKIAHAYVREDDHFLYEGLREATPKDVVQLRSLT